MHRLFSCLGYLALGVFLAPVVLCLAALGLSFAAVFSVAVAAAE